MESKEGHVRGKEDQKRGAERSREQGLLLLVNGWAWGPNSGLYTRVCEQGAGVGSRAQGTALSLMSAEDPTEPQNLDGEPSSPHGLCTRDAGLSLCRSQSPRLTYS